MTDTPLPGGPRLPSGDTSEGVSGSWPKFVDTAMRPPSSGVQHSRLWSNASQNINTAHSTGVLGARGSQVRRFRQSFGEAVEVIKAT